MSLVPMMRSRRITTGGPQFSLFLSENDFSRLGEQLSQRMNAGAPQKWKDYRVAGAGDKSVIVESVPHWIKQYIGFSELPNSDEDWGLIVRDRRYGGFVEARESTLYFLKHGAIWLDNNEELSQWRETLSHYPENVWYGRLAEESFRLWQHGEYNFVQRIAKRGDPDRNFYVLRRVRRRRHAYAAAFEQGLHALLEVACA